MAYRWDIVTYHVDPGGATTQYSCTTWVLTDADDVKSTVYYDWSDGVVTDADDARCVPGVAVVACAIRRAAGRANRSRAVRR